MSSQDETKREAAAEAAPETKPVAEDAAGSAAERLRKAVSEAKDRPALATEAAAPAKEPNAAKVRFAATATRLRARAPLAAGLAAALALGVALGGGGLAAWHRLDQVDQHRVTAAEWKRIAARLESTGSDRVAGELKALKDQLAVVRDQQAAARTDATTRAAQVADRLERLQKADKDGAEKLTALNERLDRLDREHAARLASLGDRIEKRLPAAAPAPVAATVPATPSAPAKVASADPADRTGSLPADPAKAKPADKAATLENWVLRDVFDGIAVVEGRNQRLVEVGPGETLPGAGRVEAIERRGRTWVVVTSKGIITSQAW